MSDIIWNQFLSRSDDQNGVQEALAVLLLQATFAHMCQGALVSNCVDNDGVSYSYVSGDSAAREVNFLRLCSGFEQPKIAAPVFSPSGIHFHHCRWPHVT